MVIASDEIMKSNSLYSWGCKERYDPGFDSGTVSGYNVYEWICRWQHHISERSISLETPHIILLDLDHNLLLNIKKTNL